MAQTFFNRPPRIQPEIPIGEIQIPNPPAKGTITGRLGLLTLALPLVTIVSYSFLASRGGNPLLILPMGIAAIITSIVGYLSWRNNQQNENLKQENYAHTLENLRKQVQQAHDQQLKFYLHNFPQPLALLSMAQNSDSRLWERRPSDNDFGMARIGLGRLPSTMILKPPTADNADASQLPNALKLADDYAYVKEAPITVALREVNAVGISGNQVPVLTDFVRALLIHLAALHSPIDLRIYIVGTPETKPHWKWASWLPHCSAASISAADQQLCFDESLSPKFWEGLQTELERRQTRRSNDTSIDVTLPFLVVLLDATNPAILDDVNAQAPITTLVNSGRQLGAAVLFIVKEPKDIPSECQAVISVEEAGESAYFRYVETGVNSIRRDGAADRIDERKAEQEFALKLASLNVRTTYGTELPTTLTLLDLQSAKTPEELHILERWRKSMESSSAWPSVNVGQMTGSKNRILIFEQNEGDGVHGLIAGTTGTGKSQLLMTLVVGLAVNYAPAIINFVLVDYKGGTTFEALRSLPHTVDVITNLQGHAGIRAFTAIGAELKRRENILTTYNVQDVGQYHERGFHQDAPLPHLFIIIDEFAEMIKERPEFRTQLDSIVRKGRALGVHLILATQRPGGLVSDQIQANVKFRICLRVETADDSRELLGRADAMFLPKNIPGRAYLRVGEELNLIQIAQVGNVYRGPRVDTQPPVIWINRPKRQVQSKAETGESGNVETLLDILVQLTQRLVEDNSDIRTQPKPWPDPLPAALPLGGLTPSVTEWITRGVRKWHQVDWSQQAIRTVIGKVDDPVNARQTLLELDLSHGHAVVFGVSGSGKTTFLYTVISGLVTSHSPEALNLYFLDFGKRGLSVYESLPHLGALITSDETERVQRLFRRLTDILEDRKTRLSEARVSNLKEYNRQHPDKSQPAIVLVLDNFAEFRENFSDLMDIFAALAREGRAVGIHIIVTAEQVTAIPPKIYNLFSERFALRLAENVEYVGVVGRSTIDMPDIPGRGLVRLGKVPLEFQVALPLGGIQSEGETTDTLEVNSTLIQVSEQMSESWTGKRPEQISVLPKSVPLNSVISHTIQNSIAIGLSDVDLNPIKIDLKSRGPHFTIVGPPLSGKTTALRTWLLSLAKPVVEENPRMR
jgi:S-DNA-T family DNA segregation ATPase FtsK/SpoIIIE